MKYSRGTRNRDNDRLRASSAFTPTRPQLAVVLSTRSTTAPFYYRHPYPDSNNQSCGFSHSVR
jgi:hypothetical protein